VQARKGLFLPPTYSYVLADSSLQAEKVNTAECRLIGWCWLHAARGGSSSDCQASATQILSGNEALGTPLGGANQRTAALITQRRLAIGGEGRNRATTAHHSTVPESVRRRAASKTLTANRHVGVSSLAAGLQSASSTQGAPFGTQASTTFDLARLLIILPTPHFPLQPTPLNKLSKPADRLLDRLAVANSHTNHQFSQCDFMQTVDDPGEIRG
jgi:hypothetical protein